MADVVVVLEDDELVAEVGENMFVAIGGGSGEDGATFTPSVSEDGTLSWTNDKGLENPEPVNIMGPAGAKGDTGAQGAAGSDGEPGSWHRNLLDNWYFADPINQRGQTEYKPGTVFLYTIDRWAGTRVALGLVDGGLSFAWNGTNGTYGYIIQRIENKTLAGKTVTISAIVDGVLYQKSGVFPSAGGTSLKLALPCGQFALEWSASADYPNVAVSSNSETAVVMEAIKLEFGAVSTLAGDPPPDKAQELAKCQRYFQVIKSYSGFAKAYNSAYAYAVIPLAAPLREAPAIGSDSTAVLSLWTASGSADITPQAISRYSSWNTGGSICLEFSAPTGSFTEGEMYLITSANIFLDAQL